MPFVSNSSCLVSDHFIFQNLTSFGEGKERPRQSISGLLDALLCLSAFSWVCQRKLQELPQLTGRLRLFIPIEENSEQHIYIIDKDEDGNVTAKKEYGVRYVPLTDAPKA